MVRRVIDAGEEELFDAWLDASSLGEWMRPQMITGHAISKLRSITTKRIRRLGSVSSIREPEHTIRVASGKEARSLNLDAAHSQPSKTYRKARFAVERCFRVHQGHDQMASADTRIAARVSQRLLLLQEPKQ